MKRVSVVLFISFTCLLMAAILPIPSMFLSQVSGSYQPVNPNQPSVSISATISGAVSTVSWDSQNVDGSTVQINGSSVGPTGSGTYGAVIGANTFTVTAIGLDGTPCSDTISVYYNPTTPKPVTPGLIPTRSPIPPGPTGTPRPTASQATIIPTLPQPTATARPWPGRSCDEILGDLENCINEYNYKYNNYMGEYAVYREQIDCFSMLPDCIPSYSYSELIEMENHIRKLEGELQDKLQSCRRLKVECLLNCDENDCDQYQPDGYI